MSLETATVAYDGASFRCVRFTWAAGYDRFWGRKSPSLRKAGEAATPRLHTLTLQGGSLHFQMNVEPTRASEMRMCNQKAHPVMPALDEYELMREELSVTARDSAFENSLPYAEENAQ